jgi:hypothetical protein
MNNENERKQVAELLRDLAYALNCLEGDDELVGKANRIADELDKEEKENAAR